MPRADDPVPDHDPVPGEEAGPARAPGPSRERGPSIVGAAVSLAVAVGVFGVSFGVLAVAAGLTVLQACVMSLLVFTGASQFAAVGVLDSGGSPAAALGSALLLAARNTAYGIAMGPVLEGSVAKRLVAAQLVIDESTGLALAEAEPARQRQAFWAAGVAVFVCWNVATLAGALGGQAIGDPETFGLDAAFPAGFLALLAPHLRTRDGKLAAALGAAIVLVLVPYVPEGLPILVAALAALVGLRPGSKP